MSKVLNTFNLHKPSQLGVSGISGWFLLFAVAASMTLFSSPQAGAQDPANAADQQQLQGDVQDPPPPQQDQRRVLSRDNRAQNNPDPQDSQDQDRDQSGSQQRPPASHRRQYRPSQAAQNVPGTITVPAGKVIFVRLNERLSSDHSHAGDGFTATLDQPIVVHGWVAARRGETVIGDVTTAKKAGRAKGVSQLGLELNNITIVDGQQLPLVTELWNGSAGTSHGADAAGIATTTGVGTIIGAAANGGEGAGIGAGAGAAAGIGLVLLTRGKPTVLGPESRLSFRLKEPLTISTENSSQAFVGVGPNDYNSSPSLRERGNSYGEGYPGYYAGCGPYWGCSPYYGYGYGYGPYYYGPSIGFYGGFGHGFGHRGFGRGGFRR